MSIIGALQEVEALLKEFLFVLNPDYPYEIITKEVSDVPDSTMKNAKNDNRSLIQGQVEFKIQTVDPLQLHIQFSGYNGFHIIGGEGKGKKFESFEALLTDLSPAYKRLFQEKLMAKLSSLDY